MKLGVPWSVKGIRPEARETAKEAARRAGMPLSEWLNSAILNSAAEQGLDADEDIFEQAPAELGAVNAKLDALSHRLESLTRGPEAYAPPHLRGPQAYAPPAYVPPPQAYAPMPAYVPPPPPYAPAPAYASPPQQNHFGRLDSAVAEIAARRRALNGEPAMPAAAHAAPPLAPVAPPPPVFSEPPPMFSEPPAIVRTQPIPAQDLSGLEEQLRQITERIDTLSSPGVEQAINALRDELAAITQSLNEAMPRHAIDAIERQIHGLSQRIAEGRQNGGDTSALGSLEQGLAEVRDTLRHLTPAESLSGFHEAIELLGQKIDYIVAQRDPASLEQLETAINTLRQVSTHIASNETVGRLASDVAMLAEKVERIAHVGAGDVLNGLEARISALADALAQRSQNGASVPPKLESLVASLSDKIERLQGSRDGDVAFGHLEDRIVKLVEKLDASDSRLAHLEAVERGLADLLVSMETMRAQAGTAAPRDDGHVDGLKQDIADTKIELQTVHGALSAIMDRLGHIEQGMRQPVALEDMPAPVSFGRVAARAVPSEDIAPAPVPSPPIAPMAAPPLPEPPSIQPAAAPFAPPPMPAQPAMPKPAPAEAPKRPPLPRAKSLPINPDLPPDEPLEPGSIARLRADPASRIAASEAALGNAMPEAGGPEKKSGFLAAARRAAQAAMRDNSAKKEPPVRDFADEHSGDQPALKKGMFGRVKSLFVSASIIAIVIGGLHIGTRDLNFAKKLQTNDVASQLFESESSTDVAVVETAPPATIEPAAPPPRLPGMIPPASQFGYVAGSAATANVLPAPKPPAEIAAELPPDITGSVPRPAGRQSAAVSPNNEELPTSIGGPELRKAAANGDPSAAYEIAVRFAEGRGVAASAADAARWFERAARTGLAPAQFRLGSLYEKGIGVRKDIEKAKHSYLAAAAQGNAKAMHNLAVLYAEALATKPDYDNAAKWFRKAASYGVADSQYNLGVLCARGLGTPKDFAESYKWFALAALGGDKEAAKKRDDVASYLDPKALATVQAVVKAWAAERQPPLATTVTEPAGGWDAKPAAPRQTRTSALDAKR